MFAPANAMKVEATADRSISYTYDNKGRLATETRSMNGVKNALSMTIPLGEGIHRRMVYVELEDGATLEQVTADIKADPYFASDETHVCALFYANLQKRVCKRNSVLNIFAQDHANPH